MSSLLVATGALESKTGQYATAIFAVSGAFLSLIGPLTQINSLLRTQAVIQAFLATIKNPLVGAGLVIGATAAAGIAAYSINQAANRANDRRNYQSYIQSQQQPTQTIDLRGATIRGEEDINSLARSLNQQVPRPH